MTQHHQPESLIHMEHAVTQLLAESDTSDEVLHNVLQIICESLDWAYGAYWRLDMRAQLLRRLDVWGSPSLDVKELVAASDHELGQVHGKHLLASGGLIRQTYNSGEPSWIEDISQNTSFRRGPIAAKIGLHSAFAFPIRVAEETLGIMEFFHDQIGKPNKSLVQTSRMIGNQLGQFVKRKQAEARQMMEHSITRVIGEEDTLTDFMPKIIQTICETMGWDHGSYWALDKQSRMMRQTSTWCIPSLDLTEFVQTLSETPAPQTPGGKENQPPVGGVIRRTSMSCKPIWIADISGDPTFERGQLAANAGLRSVFAFPIPGGEEIVGVLEFYSRDIRQPDGVLLEIVESIGFQIGQFFQRQEAEQVLLGKTKELEKSNLELSQFAVELNKSKETIVDILESISDAFFAIDNDGHLTYMNQQAEEALLKEPRKALLGQTVWDKLPASAYWLRDNLRKAIKKGLTLQVEGYYEPTGLWLESHIYPRQDGVSVYFRDITDRKQTEERLNYLANHDVLTGLPNRALLLDRLHQALTRAPWHNRIVAVLYCDLDRFKLINDTLGHKIGDELLKIVAERLTKCARDGDTVSRLGGDEFVVVLVDIARIEDIEEIAQRILKDLFQPYYIEEQVLVTTVSIGVSLFPNDGDNVEILLQKADIAMYRAKDQGKNAYEMYAAVMNPLSSNRLTLEKDLRSALQRDEFRLHYQPVLDLHSGNIVGAEALIRWQHSELGLIAPDEFLSIAEETGLMVEIGEWVLHTACTQTKTWQQLGLPPLRIAVNLSNRQFRQANLLQMIERILIETGLKPDQLDLELTESIVMKDTATAIETLHELRERGVRLSIDDFGTGYSSLEYLKRFPLSTLKIDRSFVKDITDDPDDAAITGAIVAMAHKLGMETVAEGVETEEQLAMMRGQDCDYAQGYLISRPLPAEDFRWFFEQYGQTTFVESST